MSALPEIPLSQLPTIDGLLSAQQVADTAAAIAAMQEPCGAIPWTTGEHVDIWNHVEAAMAMLVGGQVEAAERAYAWVPTMQRHDGSWPMKIVDGVAADERGESNMSAYFAVGVWHHWLVRGDLQFVRQYWPSVRAGLDFVTSLQASFGGSAGPRWTTSACSPAARASISPSGRALRWRSCWASRNRTGSWQAVGWATPSVRTPPSSPTSRPTRWTGTTRSWAAPSVAIAPMPCWRPVGTTSSSRAWASTASTRIRGSPARRPASSPWRWTRSASTRAPAPWSQTCSTCVRVTAATGRDGSTTTRDVRPRPTSRATSTGRTSRRPTPPRRCSWPWMPWGDLRPLEPGIGNHARHLLGAALRRDRARVRLSLRRPGRRRFRALGVAPASSPPAPRARSRRTPRPATTRGTAPVRRRPGPGRHHGSPAGRQR